jgi:hypothetical protein
MECKHVKGSCPEYCINYKRNTKKHCRTISSRSKAYRHVIKYKLSKYIKDNIDTPLVRTYITLRNSLSKDQLELLGKLMPYVDRAVSSLPVDQVKELLNELKIHNFVRVDKVKLTSEQINKVLENLSIRKSKDELLNIYRILQVILLDEADFVKKYFETHDLTRTEKRLIDVLNSMGMDSVDFFVQNPEISYYIKLRDRLTDGELKTLRDKLEELFGRLEKAKADYNQEQIQTLIEESNLCQYIKNIDGNQPNLIEIKNYAAYLEMSKETKGKSRSTICYMIASIISMSEKEIIELSKTGK